MWIEWNPNPKARMVGDCSVRAVAKALDVDWDTAYCLITLTGFISKDMPSSDAVWGSVLRTHGFHRNAISDSCPDCYTAEDFCRDNPIGTFVLGFGGHVATVKNGNLYDSWNSSNEIPQFVWYRKDD